MNWKVAGMAGTAVLTLALSGYSAVAGANKFTGNVSLSAGQTWEDDEFSPGGDDSFASIGGNAKLNIAFSSNINLQLGMTGETAFFEDNSDRKTGFQVDAHVYTRNDNYALGLFGGVGTGSTVSTTSAEYYFVGAEGQYYWNSFTFGLNAGFADSNTTPDYWGDNEFLSDAWFTNAEVRWYATPKVTVTGNVGYISGETYYGAYDQDTWHWGVKAEYWPEEKEPLSLWVAYEGHTSDFNTNVGGPDYSKDDHTVKIGVTFHFGVDGGSQANDRNGPAFNQMDYGNIVVGG
ncbi:MAG: hypothetical protein ABL973_10605 [Micropepsaceae bacterium]